MMLSARWLRTCVGSCALALVVACAGPTYKTRYYSLMADSEATPLANAEAFTSSLGVGPIRLPETLEHPGIVSHGDGQRVEVAPYDIWAGELKETVTRVLADNLSTYLATENVWPFPWDNRVRPARQASIVFERFGGQRGGEVTLQAKWRLLSTDGNSVLLSDKVSLRTETTTGSYDAYVAALNQLLNELSKEIALAVAGQQERAAP